MHLYLASRLHRVAVKQGSNLVGLVRQSRNGELHAGLIVGPLKGDERGLCAQGASVRISIQLSVRAHRNAMNGRTFCSLQMITDREHRWMLDRRGDDLVASWLNLQRGENCCVVGFTSPGGKDDLLVRFCTKQRLNLPARNPDGIARSCTQRVCRRWVGKVLAKERKHGIYDAWRYARGGVVIQIDPWRGRLFFCHAVSPG